MAKHMKVNLTGKGFLSDEIDAHTCPVCKYDELDYEPTQENVRWDGWTGSIYVYVDCPKCGSSLSACFDFHDVQVDFDERFLED